MMLTKTLIYTCVYYLGFNVTLYMMLTKTLVNTFVYYLGFNRDSVNAAN